MGGAPTAVGANAEASRMGALTLVVGEQGGTLAEGSAGVESSERRAGGHVAPEGANA